MDWGLEVAAARTSGAATSTDRVQSLHPQRALLHALNYRGGIFCTTEIFTTKRVSALVVGSWELCGIRSRRRVGTWTASQSRGGVYAISVDFCFCAALAVQRAHWAYMGRLRESVHRF